MQANMIASKNIALNDFQKFFANIIGDIIIDDIKMTPTVFMAGIIIADTSSDMIILSLVFWLSNSIIFILGNISIVNITVPSIKKK